MARGEIDSQEDGVHQPFSPLSKFHGMFAKGSEFGATMTLAVSTIGAGVLALPSAFAHAGILLALATVLLVGYLSVVTIRYIVQAMIALKLSSYESISRELLGPSIETLSRSIVIFYNAGASIGYVIVLRNILEPFRSYFVSTSPFFEYENGPVILLWAILLVPLSCVRSLKNLQGTSTLAIAAASYTALMVTFRYFFPGPTQVEGDIYIQAMQAHKNKHWHHPSGNAADVTSAAPSLVSGAATVLMYSFSWGSVLSLAIMMFAFDCQVMIFQIYSNLRHPSLAAVTRVSCGNFLVSGLVYSLVGACGYLSFPGRVEDNILSNYDPTRDMLAAVAYVVYAVPISMAFVLFMFPIRDSFFQKWYGVDHTDEVDAKHYFGFTLLLDCFCLVGALYIPSIAIVCAILGGLCASFLCYILPASFVLKLHYNGLAPASSLALLQQWVIFIFGCCTCVFGTAVSLQHAIYP